MERYYYLAYSVLFFGILLCLLRNNRQAWRQALPMMFLGTILGPLSEYLYTRDYWHPDMVVSWGHFSLENVLFGAALCGIAATLYPVLVKRELPQMKHRTHLQHIWLLVGGLGSFGLITLLSITTNHNSLITASAFYGLLWALIAVQQPLILRASFVTASLCTLFVLVVYAIGLNSVAPDYLEKHWLLYGTPFGKTILGNVPVTEIWWFFTVTGFFSALYAFVYKVSYGEQFGTQFSRKPNLVNAANQPTTESQLE